MDPREKSDAGDRGHRAGAAPMRWPIVCWVGILVLIGVIQIVRAQTFDAVVFFVATVLVVVSSRMPQRSASGVSPRTLVLGAAVLAAGMSLLPRHSPAMMVAVICTGIVALVVAWPGSRAGSRGASGRWPTALRRLGIAWAAILVVGCVWELAQFILGEIDPARPSYALSDLVDPMLDTALGRVVFLAAWLACGVFLLRRGSRP